MQKYDSTQVANEREIERILNETKQMDERNKLENEMKNVSIFAKTKFSYNFRADQLTTNYLSESSLSSTKKKENHG